MDVATPKQAWQYARNLKKKKTRDELGRFLIEGISLVAEALDAGIRVDFILCTREAIQREKSGPLWETASHLGIPVFLVSEEKFQMAAVTDNPQGVLAVGYQPAWRRQDLADSGVFVALDRLQDPGNVGTIIRTANAAGAAGVFLSPGSADLFNPKVLRAGMGSTFRLPAFNQVDLVEVLAVMKGKGGLVVAADPRSDVIYYRTGLTKRPLLLVVGNEGRGVSPELLELADIRVKIPLQGGVESLNAAVAAALILYEVARQDDQKRQLVALEKP